MTTPRRPLALFVNSFGGGGAEKNTVMLANGFIAQGHQVDVIVERDEGSYRTMLSPEAHVVDLASTSPFVIVPKLCRYFRNTPPRMIFAHLEKPALYSIVAGLFTGYRKIVPCIHVDLNSYAKIDHALRRQFLRLLLAIFYRFSARVLSVSDGCKNSLAPLMGAQAKKIITVYNGFDLETLRAVSRQPVDHPLIANKNKPYFIGCGRLSAQKNFALLIRAFAEVRQKYDAGLIILGEGPQRAELEALSRTLGVDKDVHMPGFQPSPLSWFGKCDAFVLSSNSEGLPNVLIEALMTGVTMISTDCESGPQEVLDGGKYGTIVPVNDVPALAAAMCDVLDPTKPTKLDQTEVQAYVDRTFAYHLMIKGYLNVAHIVESEA